MKKVLIVLMAVLLGVGLFFYLRGRSTSDSVTGDNTEKHNVISSTPDENKNSSENKQEKGIALPMPTPSKPVATNLEEFTKELDVTIENGRKELEECENNFDRLFGNALEEENPQIYNEDQLSEILDEFDRMSLNPKSSSRLLELLAQDQVAQLKTEELGNKLKDMRPCRPYKKMSFIHGLMSEYLKKRWSESMRQRALATAFNYFERELADHTTITNLNMQASLLQTLVSEGMLNKKCEEKVMDFKDSLEDAYDDLLDQADEKREAKEEKGEQQEALPLDIIKSEFKLSNKYRQDMRSLLHEVKGGCQP